MLLPLLIQLCPFELVQMYMSDLISHDTPATQEELQIRACWALLIIVCMLKRIKRKSPTLFDAVQSWTHLHSHKTASELFGLNTNTFK
jgi:hypothetical protein